MKLLTFTLIFTSCFFVACINHKNTCLLPNKNLEMLLDSFVRINNSFHVYELYIDKLDPDHYNLIIYAGDKSLTENECKKFNQSSLAYCNIRSVNFHIYSGIEHYFKQDYIQNKDLIKSKNNYNHNALWAVKDSFGIIISYKIDGGYPFLPLPLLIKNGDLKPPIVEED